MWTCLQDCKPILLFSYVYEITFYRRKINLITEFLKLFLWIFSKTTSLLCFSPISTVKSLSVDSSGFTLLIWLLTKVKKSARISACFMLCYCFCWKLWKIHFLNKKAVIRSSESWETGTTDNEAYHSLATSSCRDIKNLPGVQCMMWGAYLHKHSCILISEISSRNPTFFYEKYEEIETK